MITHWHVVTPELPPACGGVGDYVAQLTEALAANGDDVTVYAPPAAFCWNPPKGVEVMHLDDRFGPRAIRTITRRLSRQPGARLLVQYVPAVFGRRGTNVGFCRWLLSRRHAGVDVRVMFHEPYLHLRWRPDQIVTAFTQRAMAAILLDAARYVYLSTDTWRRYLGRLRPGAIHSAVTLPIPSAIPCVDASHVVRATRSSLIGQSAYLVGHFGSYGDHIAPMLRTTFKDLLTSDPRIAILCTGNGSDRFVKRFIASNPAIQTRIVACGRGAAEEISLQLQACDVLLQPYPDGVTTRRTSVMAGLANRCAIVTTDGRLTEGVWRASDCVALTPAGDAGGLADRIRELLSDRSACEAFQSRALATYESCFALRHTIDVLRAECPQLSLT
jgi:glycosyltransferase involved in cell wall biosynthesis